MKNSSEVAATPISRKNAFNIFESVAIVYWSNLSYHVSRSITSICEIDSHFCKPWLIDKNQKFESIGVYTEGEQQKRQADLIIKYGPR